MVESCPATRGVVKIPWFLRFGRCVALAYFSLALLAVAFLAPRLPYACKGEEASLSLPSLAVVVIVGLLSLWHWLRDGQRRTWTSLVFKCLDALAFHWPW